MRFSKLGIIENIDIRNIKEPPDYYRSISSSDLNELVSSIMQKGLLQPITVRSAGEYFQVVAGNRRLHACKALGWRKIVCHIVELNDKEAFEVSLIENIQRKSLSPLDEARSFDAYIREFGWGGVTDLAKKIGKSTSYVDKRLRLLDLPPDILEQISSYLMSTSNAEELISVHDENKQKELADIICQTKLSHRETRHLIKNYKNFMLESPCYSIVASGNIATLKEKAQRSFDKCIITLRIALTNLAPIIESIEEDNWAVREMLMEHKNILNAQINSLIREKKKVMMRRNTIR
jgi:ParB family chromosome partitioning protein